MGTTNNLKNIRFRDTGHYVIVSLSFHYSPKNLKGNWQAALPHLCRVPQPTRLPFPFLSINFLLVFQIPFPLLSDVLYSQSVSEFSELLVIFCYYVWTFVAPTTAPGDLVPPVSSWAAEAQALPLPSPIHLLSYVSCQPTSQSFYSCPGSRFKTCYFHFSWFKWYPNPSFCSTAETG